MEMTKKEEKKSDLEQLLNSLVDAGWKPRGEKVNKVIKIGIDEFGDEYVLFDGELNGYYQRGWSMTELVSKGSGLWQFVCENGMVKKLGDNLKYFYNSRDELGTVWYYEDRYKYRVIESALCDEDKLEEFLLQNIKIEGKNE